MEIRKLDMNNGRIGTYVFAPKSYTSSKQIYCSRLNGLNGALWLHSLFLRARPDYRLQFGVVERAWKWMWERGALVPDAYVRFPDQSQPNKQLPHLPARFRYVLFGIRSPMINRPSSLQKVLPESAIITITNAENEPNGPWLLITFVPLSLVQ
jgi:hypothetical protein